MVIAGRQIDAAKGSVLESFARFSRQGIKRVLSGPWPALAIALYLTNLAYRAVYRAG